MPLNVNRVQFAGCVGGEVRANTLPSGLAVTDFRLCCNKSSKDKQGKWQSHPTWMSVSCFKETAERAAKLTKGDNVYVEGRIQIDEYTDKQGQKRTSTKIVADHIQAIRPPASGGGETEGDQSPKQEKPKQTRRPKSQQAPSEGQGDSFYDGEVSLDDIGEIPF